MTNRSERQNAACHGLDAIEAIRLGLDAQAYEGTVHAVRAAARAMAQENGCAATVAQQTISR